MLTGLYVCTFDFLNPRKRPSLIEPADGITVGLTPTFRWTAAADQNEDPHLYEIHLRGQFRDTTFVTRDTSFVIPPGVLSVTGPSDWFVIVKDEYTEVSSQDTFHFAYLPDGVAGDRRTPRSFALEQNYPNPFNPLT